MALRRAFPSPRARAIVQGASRTPAEAPFFFVAEPQKSPRGRHNGLVPAQDLRLGEPRPMR